MPSTVPFQQLIGQTEKTMNAILDRELAGAVSEAEWVALVLISSGGSAGQDQFAGRLAHALKVDQPTAERHIGQLAAKGLVRTAPETCSAVALTEAGQQFVSRVQQRIRVITHRLWGDLPADDLAAASKVLTVVLERAEAELKIMA
jgi:DNA-binding MarR family transcriptional regulator